MDDKSAPARPIDVLQTTDLSRAGIPSEIDRQLHDLVREAAQALAYHMEPTQDEGFAHQALSRALTEFLVAIVGSCPPGPERSSAIANAREAKAWASAAVAMQRHNRPPGD